MPRKPPVSTEHFSDGELLTLCRLADDIHARGMALTMTERAFLAIMRAKELWTPKGE